MMAIHPKYKPPEIDSKDLRTPVEFWFYVPNDGPDPGELQEKKLYECTCLAYNPSMKDMEILSAIGTDEGLTIKIRDPHQDYIPTNKHKVIIDDYRIDPEKEWEIKNVAPDYEDNRFVKIVIGVVSQ